MPLNITIPLASPAYRLQAESDTSRGFGGFSFTALPPLISYQVGAVATIMAVNDRPFTNVSPAILLCPS
jgi:hypothetical protein